MIQDHYCRESTSLNTFRPIALILASATGLASFSCPAKDKMISLTVETTQALQGKTAAVTLHERPTFMAMTAGKATFALIGAGAMAKAGNDFVEKNDIQDPAAIVRAQLGDLLQSSYGLQLKPVDATVTKEQKPEKLAALHPEADYVFSVRSGGWNYAYYPSQWSQYWVGYSVQVQLIDTKTGTQVANMACNANTHQNPNHPTKEQLEANGAQLTKDVTAGLGWTCVQLLAKSEFLVPEEKLPAIPAQYVDPLAALKSQPASTEASSPKTP